MPAEPTLTKCPWVKDDSSGLWCLRVQPGWAESAAWQLPCGRVLPTTSLPAPEEAEPGEVWSRLPCCLLVCSRPGEGVCVRGAPSREEPAVFRWEDPKEVPRLIDQKLPLGHCCCSHLLPSASPLNSGYRNMCVPSQARCFIFKSILLCCEP